MGHLETIGLLLWKNALLQKRRKWMTLAQIFFPMFFFAILALLRVSVPREDGVPQSFCSQSISSEDYFRPLMDAYASWGYPAKTTCTPSAISIASVRNQGYNAVAYTPDTPEVRQVLALFQGQLQLLDNFVTPAINLSFIPFATAAALERIVESTSPKYLFGVVFQQDSNGAAGSPGIQGQKVHYQLRFASDYMTNFPNTQSDSELWGTITNFFRNPRTLPRTENSYTNSFFTFFQQSMDAALLQYLHPQNVSSPVLPRLKPLSFPSYRFTRFINALGNAFPLMIVLSFIFTAANIIRELTFEKEKRLREAMRILGVSDKLHWLAHFIWQFVFLFFTSIVIAAILVGGKVVENSTFGFTLLFFLVFGLSVILFCFAMSSFFSTASVATAFGTLLFFLFFVPFLFVMRPDIYASLSRGAMVGMCLLPQTCMGLGTRIWVNKEASGIGMSVDNMSTLATDADVMTMSGIFGMLILDCFIFGFISWYMENAFPGEYGIARPWNFFLQPSYWRRGTAVAVPPGTGQPSFAVVEDTPRGTEFGIDVDRVTKEFDGVGGLKTAVDNLSVKFVKNHINVLLGHNGAGKTTTMSMLVGYFPGTRGAIRINGVDVFADVKRARQSLGFCPQFDVLFELLSVREHLWLFARLKGIEGDALKHEVETYIDKLGIRAKAESPVSVLSGGQRRAVSVSLALIGGPTTVVLDEPTSGMDTYKRRQTWDLLLSERQGRTILLSTHDMEEAEVLGDHIAIMADGALRVMGTPMFLKQRFGFGYELTILRSPGAIATSDEILQAVQVHVSEAYVKDEVGAELKLLLPKDQAAAFPRLLQDLEDRRDALQIASFGVSVTTLEEIFLNVTSADPTPEGLDGHSLARNARRVSHERPSIPLITAKPRSSLSPMRAALLQFTALFQKRILQWRRSPRLLVIMFLLPLILAIVGLGVVSSLAPIDNEPILLFNLQRGYQSNTMYYSHSDAGGDHYSGSFATTAAALGRDGVRAPTPLQLRLRDALGDVLSQDSRFSITSLATLTAANVTSFILGAARNYYVNLFYRRNLVALTTQPGAFRLQSTGTSCSLRVDDTYVGPTPLTLAAGQAYEFALTKSAPTDTLSISTSATHAPNTDLLTSPVSATNLTRVDSGRISGMRWTVPSSFVGTTLYLFCSPTQTTGLPLTITADPALASNATGATAYAWFSIDPYHTAPESVNLLTNTIARTHIGPAAAIYTYNYPLPKPPQLKVKDSLSGDAITNLGVFFMMVTGFLGACFAIFPVSERVSKAKHIQLVSGASRTLFWVSSFAFDYIAYFCVAFAIFIIFAAFNITQYAGEQLGFVFLLLFLFGFALIPFIYLLSFLFSDSSAAFSRLTLIMTLGGMGAIFAVLITARPALGLVNTSKVLKWIFYPVPHFAFVQGLIDLYNNKGYHDFCTGSDAARIQCLRNDYIPNDNYLGWADPGAGRSVVFLFITTVLSWIGIAIVECWPAVATALRLRATSVSPPREAEDMDVAQERARVEGSGNDKDLVRAVNLSKAFVKEDQLMFAVKNLSFGIAEGECFGLLGVNGAGKSTTFSLLTGEQAPSGGASYLRGFDVYRERAEACRYMGFCPQFDGLIGVMTGREHLALYAALRGLSAADAQPRIDDLLDELNLHGVADKLAGTYSGGNKRRLSTALALLGDHPVIFLDEPTTGVDPKARREMWNFLSMVIRGGRSIVLTSHSMAECEALCTRLAIMVDGRFRALGTLQHLKGRYGNGYKLTVKMRHDANTEMLLAVKDFLHSQIADLTLLQEHNGELEFQARDIAVGALFATMEGLKAKFQVDDYGVVQTTLEQVFINFAQRRFGGEPPESSSDAGIAETRLPMHAGEPLSFVQSQ